MTFSTHLNLFNFWRQPPQISSLLTDPCLSESCYIIPQPQPVPVKRSYRWEAVKSLVSPIGWIYQTLRNYGQGFARSLIYAASSAAFKKKLKIDRLERSRNLLRSIGGITIAIRTDDGVMLESMFFDVNEFHRRIVAMGGQFYLNANGEQVLDTRSISLKKLLNDLGIDNIKKCFFRTVVSRPDGSLIAATRPCEPFIPPIQSKHVMILTQGNGGIVEFSRNAIAEILMNGMSCMAFNIRGTGRSEGMPTEEGTYHDIESVYQYLRNRGIRDHQISVYGYCLGSGLAVDLASRHPVSLILDRPFAKISDVIAHIATENTIRFFHLDVESTKTILIKRCFDEAISKLIDWFYISYGNSSKLSSVRGPIFLIESGIDEVIPQFSRQHIREAVIRSGGFNHVSAEMGHCDISDYETKQLLLHFLRRYNFLRNFPVTHKAVTDYVFDATIGIFAESTSASYQSVLRSGN